MKLVPKTPPDSGVLSAVQTVLLMILRVLSLYVWLSEIAFRNVWV
jgi:hypothetical protein